MLKFKFLIQLVCGKTLKKAPYTEIKERGRENFDSLKIQFNAIHINIAHNFVIESFPIL